MKAGESGSRWREAQRNSLLAGPERVTQGSPCLGYQGWKPLLQTKGPLTARHPHSPTPRSPAGWEEECSGEGGYAAWGQVKRLRFSSLGHPFLPLLLVIDYDSSQDTEHIQAGPISYPILGSVTVGQRKKGWCVSKKASRFPLLLRCIEQPCP